VAGPWRLVREIGRGGGGQVFEAVHVDPTDGRRVALKVIPDGRMTPGQAEQFLQERALLARLEHPCIARLYDTGRTPGGAPYFTMEFVDGVPADRWLEQHPSGIRKLIEIFVQVTRALAYAHARMVVHGDLKPANLLIKSESGEPRILDFGAGRSLQNPGEPVPWIMLTPEYASPEQARGEPVTAASDLYQVGVLLRRLMPLTREKADIELRAIAARCTQPEPALRYSSADALCSDLEAWLQHRPVSAMQGSGAWYRARKAIRRNPTGVMLAASLVIGMAATGWQAWRAHQNSLQSRHRFEETRRVTRAMFQDIGRLPVAARKPIVENLATLLNRTADPKEADPEVLLELSRAWRTLGRVQGLPTSSNLGDSVGAMQSYAKAIHFAERARQADDKAGLEWLVILYSDTTRISRFEGEASNAQVHFGKLEAATSALRRYGPSATVAFGLGEIAFHRGTGNRNSGIEAFRLAVQAYEQAGLAQQLPFATTLKQLGALLLAENRLEESSKQYSRALALEKANKLEAFNMSYTLSDLSLISARQKHYSEALGYCREAMAIREAAHAQDPGDIRATTALANSTARMAMIHYEMGQFELAAGNLRNAISLRKEIHERNPSQDAGADLGSNLVFLARVLNKLDASRHRPEIASLLAATETLLARRPNDQLARYWKEVASEVNLGRFRKP
jgi:eukaryotic-like serine/threonine-protein kinase